MEQSVVVTHTLPGSPISSKRHLLWNKGLTSHHLGVSSTSGGSESFDVVSPTVHWHTSRGRIPLVSLHCTSSKVRLPLEASLYCGLALHDLL